jgi:hypothetical protein
MQINESTKYALRLVTKAGLDPLSALLTAGHHGRHDLPAFSEFMRIVRTSSLGRPSLFADAKESV